MRILRPITVSFAVVAALCGGTGCGRKKAAPRTDGPRPVTVVELRTIDPVGALQLTGAISAWAEQDIAFEVEGRMQRIVEQGTYLSGRWEQDGNVVLKGDPLATVEPQPYEIAKETAAAAVEVAQLNLGVAEVQLEKVLPANLLAAQAEKRRAEAEFERYKKARETNAIAEVDFIRATADRDSKDARYQQAEAAMETQKADIASLKATVKQAAEKLRQAEWDLARCTLYAPFSGEVSKVYIEAGGYARKGEAVAHLVMMDPIFVEVSVAPQTARDLRDGDTVKIFPPLTDKPLTGAIYKKSTVADPDTRTFRISIMVRNQRLISNRPPGDPLLERPQVSMFMYLRRLVAGDPKSPYCAEENRALRKDEQGHYVWAAPDFTFGDSFDPENPLLTLKKFRVTPGSYRGNYQGLYLVRGLDDIGELKPGTLVALDVPEGVKDGDQILFAVPDWLLRPSQLVPVILGGAVPRPGLYLPMDAIKPTGEGTGEILVVAEDKARRIAVKIVDSVGELFRVEAAKSEDAGVVAEGTLVITDYIHFLQDGESVRVVQKREIRA